MVEINIEYILVPLQFNKGGRTALNQAMFFQKVYSSKITLLHIVPPANILRRIFRKREMEIIKKGKQKRLTRFVEKECNGTIPDYFDLKIIVGELVPTILKTAKNPQYDLIIIKKSKKTNGFFYKLRKHNTDRIIGASSCPVLTIKETWTKMGIREILLPLDIGKQIKAKVYWAIEIAKKFNAKIRIVSVLRLDIDIKDSYTFKKAETLESWIKSQGIDCDIKILKSKEHNMYEAVQFLTLKESPDLTIIMTHQESTLNENYIGKFATEIIHNSPTPVLSIVPGPDNVFSSMLNFLNIK